MRKIALVAALFYPAMYCFAAEIKPSIDYRLDFKSDDLGMSAGDTPEKYSNSIKVPTARLSLKSDLDATTSFKARYNFSKAEIEEGYVMKTCADTSLYSIFGYKKVYQGGYFQKKSSTQKLIGGNYIDTYKPFSSYKPVIELGYKVAESTASVQFLNDVTTKDKIGVHADRHKQPAWISQLDMKFKPLVSMLQYGSYDLNHSHFISYSLGFSNDIATVTLDYVYDSRDVGTKTTAEGSDDVAVSNIKRDVMTSIQVDAEVTVSDLMYFLQAAKYDRKQAGKNLEANQASGTKVVMDDNAGEIAVGVRCLAISKAAVPYVGFVARQGNFFEGTTTDKESRLQRIWMAGVTGEI